MIPSRNVQGKKPSEFHYNGGNDQREICEVFFQAGWYRGWPYVEEALGIQGETGKFYFFIGPLAVRMARKQVEADSANLKNVLERTLIQHRFSSK